MLLKSLEIQGFKTFPDKTELKFEDGFVAVVGPNGSGKSNVSDAIRWVLGEQSTRTLRCVKMEDVIFKGTTKRKALGYAEVTMNIDNSDRALDFDNDSISITRRYYRSGDSEYMINKASVRLKDLNELFMDTGLGRDGYSMIGQGKIDSIVAAKSEDRREIFEEASGISKYRYRKEESERRLEKAEENLIRLRDILSELEERVGPLKIQSEKAQRFIEFDSEKQQLEIGLWVATLNRSGAVLREQEDKIAVSQNQYNEIESQLEKIASDIEKNYQDTNNCTSEIESLRAESAGIDEEVTRISGEISVLENDILHAKQNIERLEKEISLSMDSDKSIDKEIEEKNKGIKSKEADIDSFNKNYIDLADKLESLRKGTDSYSKQIDDAMIESAKLTADLSEERIRQSSAEAALEEINSRKDGIDSAIAENEKNTVSLNEENGELEEMLKALDEKLSESENSIEGYRLKLSSKTKKAEGLKSELDKTSLDAAERSRRAKLLEDLERNFEGFNQSVKAVMKESERGTLSGIHGPVTKIIKTDKQYTVAIETALGAAMQNIVVGTDFDAKVAISFLKRRDAGRATFLPLTTIKGYKVDTSAVSSSEGYVGIASELVICDSRYNGIRDSLLGRTVISDNLDNAVKIAKKASYKFRIVTLDGQTVNAGGSLTGGSLARNSGLLRRASDIEKLKSEALELNKAVEKLSSEYKVVSEELSGINAEIELKRAEIQTTNEDRVRVSAELSRIKRDIENSIKNGEDLKLEKNDSDKRIAELNTELSQAKDKSIAINDKISTLRKTTDSLNNEKLSQQSACDEISIKLQEIKLSGFAAEKDIEALKNAVALLNSRKNDSAGTAERLNNEIEASKKLITEIEAQIDAQNKRADILKKSSAEKLESVESVSQRRNTLEKSSGELRQKERDISASRENVGHEIARLQERSDNLQKEYDSIISKLWEEYELTKREAEEKGIVIEDMQASQKRLTELKNKIRALGSVNVAAVVEYKEVSERYEFLKAQIADVEKSRLELLKLINELTGSMTTQFSERFAEINSNFVSIFKELFGGGTANLSFSDPSDILNSGIDIMVHPPGKIVSNIEALSGGEKALVAISIYFAIMKVSPPPFCMLDEVEAALDDENVRRFADYLHRMNDKTQFIVVTHRRGTMEEADMLYGVTMQDDGVSKLLSLSTNEVEEKLGMKNN